MRLGPGGCSHFLFPPQRTRCSEWALGQPMYKPVGQGIGQVDSSPHVALLVETSIFFLNFSHLNY
jgi:hypothetical protein